MQCKWLAFFVLCPCGFRRTRCGFVAARRCGASAGRAVLCVVSGLASAAAATVWRDGAWLCVEGGEPWRGFLLFAGSFKFLPGMGSCLPSGFAPACSLAAVRRATRCTPLSDVETAVRHTTGWGRRKFLGGGGRRRMGGLFAWLANVFGKLRRRGPWLR